MNLLIVESPNKIKKIKSYLGSGFEVKASVGHISDLAISKGWDGLGIEDNVNWKGIYVVSEEKKKVVADLKSAVAKTLASNGTVYLATDPDREGEAISWHLANVLGLRKNFKRVTFNEISEKALNEAIRNARSLDYALIEAQESRRLIDRVYGFKGSNLISRTDRELKSVGRVQSAGLRLVVDRELEIQSFKSQKYLEPIYKVQGLEFKIKLSTEELISKDWKQVDFPKEVSIESIELTKAKDNPPKPLTTNEALKVGAGLKLDAKTTTKYLQELFEEGLVTYIRTDSNNVSEEFKQVAKEYIEGVLGLRADISRVYKNSENAQEAHEAIRPVHIEDDGSSLGNTAKAALYKQIRSITIQSQLETGIDNIQSIKFESAGFSFENRSKTIELLGYREFAGVDQSQYALTKLAKGTYAAEVDLKDKSTSAPSRFSEASFLSKLESEGIGRPSTYASILQTVFDRGYVVKEKTSLLPTDQGFRVIVWLKNNFPQFIDLAFTANMELQLDEVANHKGNKLGVMKDFWEAFEPQFNTVNQAVSQKETATREIYLEKKALEQEALKGKYGDCEKCGKPLAKKAGKFGDFFGCSDYPKCNYIKKEAKPNGYKVYNDVKKSYTKKK